MKFLALLAVAGAVHGRAHLRRKPSPKLDKAALKFEAPADKAEIEPGTPIRVALSVENAPSVHLHLIVDNDPAVEVPDTAPLRLTGLKAGPHLLRAVLCRPGHEVVKARGAFALTRFWVGPPLEGKAGRAAEFVAWPDPRKPILTYVLPVGKGERGFVLEREVQQEPGAGAPLPPPTAGAEKPVLDFYLANAKLARRGDKVRIVLDKRELPLITEWKPQHLRRARPGPHKLTIDLLNRRGLKVKNAVNRTDRNFTVP